MKFVPCHRGADDSPSMRGPAGFRSNATLSPALPGAPVTEGKMEERRPPNFI